MGGGTYNFNSANTRSVSHQSRSTQEVFTQKDVHEMMKPFGVKLRESRDSAEHPASLPIILALDVTGSMDHIPDYIVKHALPKIMSHIIEHGIADPQIMFVGIGDHITDRGPLQISQFESADAELDMWLTRVWLEGRGGGNRGESYSLIHFFANQCVKTDAWEKRQEKGFLFTIGDERFHEKITSHEIQSLMGDNELGDLSSIQEIKKAMQQWNVYHIVPGNEKDDSIAQWKDVLGMENVIVLSDYKDVGDTISNIVTKYPRQKPAENNTQAQTQYTEYEEANEDDDSDDDEEDTHNNSTANRRR